MYPQTQRSLNEGAPTAPPSGRLSEVYQRLRELDHRVTLLVSRTSQLADRLMGPTLRDAPKSSGNALVERDPPDVEKLQRAITDLSVMLGAIDEELQRLETL